MIHCIFKKNREKIIKFFLLRYIHFLHTETSYYLENSSQYCYYAQKREKWMGIKYSKIALCLALCSSVYAQSFSVTSQSLEETIQSIATQAKMPYIADGKLLKGKKAPTFSNVETPKEALCKVLEGSGLEAVIENETIMIQPKVQVVSTNDNDAVVLKPISISSTPQSTVATTVIDSTYIQSAPTANHTITDLFRGKSYVQFDQSSLSFLPQEVR